MKKKNVRKRTLTFIVHRKRGGTRQKGEQKRSTFGEQRKKEDPGSPPEKNQGSRGEERGPVSSLKKK